VILFVSSAAATVLGAAVGAAAALGAETIRQAIKFVRDRRLDEKLRIGVARVWSKSLCDFDELLWRQVICPMSECETAAWWQDVEDVPGLISVDDMKRVAAVANAEAWKQIDWAETHVRRIRGRRAEQIARGQPPELDAYDLRRAVSQIEKAALALAALAGDPEENRPKFEWRDEACLERLASTSGGAGT